MLVDEATESFSFLTLARFKPYVLQQRRGSKGIYQRGWDN